MLNEQSLLRYDRHIKLKNIGLDGQVKLSKAKVLVVGAGGLGSPVLQYLSAAGIGTIGIVDHDIVSLSNLQRQVIYNIDDIDKNKAVVAKAKLTRLNDQIAIEIFPYELNVLNAIEIIEQFDIVVDCTDNFSTRYMINDACLILNKVLVYGAIHSFEGQISVFNYKGGATYRCLFPKAPLPGSIRSCNEIGVMGTLPGIIGAYQANEVIKCILDIGNVLTNQVLTINTLNHEHHIFKYNKQEKLEHVPQCIHSFETMDYVSFCGIGDEKEEVSFTDIKDSLLGDDIILLDVRELLERPLFDHSEVIRIPCSTMNYKEEIFKTDKTIYVFCHSGIRSFDVVKNVRLAWKNCKIKSIKGGILRMN